MASITDYDYRRLRLPITITRDYRLRYAAIRLAITISRGPLINTPGSAIYTLKGTLYVPLILFDLGLPRTRANQLELRWLWQGFEQTSFFAQWARLLYTLHFLKTSKEAAEWPRSCCVRW